MRVLTITLCLLLAAATPAAAQDPEIMDGSAQRALDQARASWAAVGIRDYAYTLRHSCFCPPPNTEDNTVRGGVAEQGRTIEQVFDLVQREIDTKPDDYRASYDSATGRPLEMSVDRYEEAVDDEYGFLVQDFRQLDPPPPPPPPPVTEPEPPAARDRLAEARAAWRASGIRRHSLVVTRRCPGRRPYVRRDWTVPRLHAFIARSGAEARFGRRGVPRLITAGSGCSYTVTRFKRAR